MGAWYVLQHWLQRQSWPPDADTCCLLILVHADDKTCLDLHLCNVVGLSRQALLLAPASHELQLDHVEHLLDAVYFLWFDRQQLERGAKNLVQVLSSLFAKSVMHADPCLRHHHFLCAPAGCQSASTSGGESRPGRLVVL